jgi:DNA-binding transcriptional LysR family regulator
MEFRDLHYLLAIAQAKSISKAAQGLFMSQSSLSQALRLMEDELGGKLFTRTSTGVRPTQAGELMIQRAQKILGEYHQTQQMIQDMENLEAGRVDFGISTFRGGYLLPPALCRFCQRYPNIQVEIREENSMALEQLLIEGQLDLALIALPPVKLKDQVELLLQDEILLVVSHDHPVNALSRECVLDTGEVRRYVEVEDTMAYDYILSDYDTILGSLSRAAWYLRCATAISPLLLPPPWLGLVWALHLPTAPAGRTTPTRSTTLLDRKGSFWIWDWPFPLGTIAPEPPSPWPTP